MKVRPHEGVTVVAGGVDECGHGGEEEDTEKERKKIKRRRGGSFWRCCWREKKKFIVKRKKDVLEREKQLSRKEVDSFLMR